MTRPVEFVNRLHEIESRFVIMKRDTARRSLGLR